MKKTLNFSSNEMLDNNKLFTLKGGGTDNTIGNGDCGLGTGGGETDKRPKKPAVTDSGFGKSSEKL